MIGGRNLSGAVWELLRAEMSVTVSRSSPPRPLAPGLPAAGAAQKPPAALATSRAGTSTRNPRAARALGAPDSVNRLAAGIAADYCEASGRSF